MSNLPVSEILLGVTTLVAFAAGSVYTYFVLRKELDEVEATFAAEYKVKTERYSAPEPVEEAPTDQQSVPESAEKSPIVDVIYSRAEDCVYSEIGLVLDLEFPEGVLDGIDEVGAFSYYDTNARVYYQVEVV